MPVKKREVVNPIADLVVRDDVARTRKSRSQSLSEVRADLKVRDGTRDTLEAMELEQKRDGINALIRQRDALRKEDPKASSVAGIQRAQSMVVDVMDDFHLCVKEAKRGAHKVGYKLSHAVQKESREIW